MPLPLVALGVGAVAAGKAVYNQIKRGQDLKRTPFRVTNLLAGDVLMKFNSRDWDVMNWVIEGVQTFSLRDSAYVVHGGIVGPNTSRMIEMDGSGVVSSDLYAKNAGYNYLVFRSRMDCGFRYEAAQIADDFRLLHQEKGSMGYSIPSLVPALAPRFGKFIGGANSTSDLKKRFEKLMNVKERYDVFCTEFVVLCFQFAAVRRGIDPSTIFHAAALVSNPSYLTSCLHSSPIWSCVGALRANVR